MCANSECVNILSFYIVCRTNPSPNRTKRDIHSQSDNGNALGLKNPEKNILISNEGAGNSTFNRSHMKLMGNESKNYTGE